MTITDTATINAEQAAADAAEGLLPATNEMIMLHAAYVMQREANSAGAKIIKDIRDTIGAHIVGSGVQGFTHDGAVIVRLSERTTSTVDLARIKKEDPDLYRSLFARFPKTTITEEIKVR